MSTYRRLSDVPSRNFRGRQEPFSTLFSGQLQHSALPRDLHPARQLRHPAAPFALQQPLQPPPGEPFQRGCRSPRARRIHSRNARRRNGGRRLQQNTYAQRGRLGFTILIWSPDWPTPATAWPRPTSAAASSFSNAAVRLSASTMRVIERLHQRQQLFANPDPRERFIVVHFINSEIDLPRAGSSLPCHYAAPRRATGEQASLSESGVRVPHRQNAAQSFGGAAAQQSHQNCFRLIVERVRRQDEVRSLLAWLFCAETRNALSSLPARDLLQAWPSLVFSAPALESALPITTSTSLVQAISPSCATH